jgi:hypothetical protein
LEKPKTGERNLAVTKYCRIAKIMDMANVDVRFGQERTFAAPSSNVRYSPEGGHPI